MYTFLIRKIFCILILSSGFTFAQTYPTKPIRLVVTSSPGASSDILARAIANQISKSMDVPVVVENRPGAGGNVAGAYVKGQAADGYTLMLASVSSHAINSSLYDKMPYDPIKDFTPIIALASNPNALVVSASSGITTVGQLISRVQADPTSGSFSSGGSGTSQHLSAEIFQSMAKLKMLHVPYKGSPEALMSVAKGETLMMFPNIPNAISLAKSGTIRMLAVTSARRLPWLPEVPTVAEAGLPGFEATAWFGLVAPAGTPVAIVEKINYESGKALRDPEVTKMLVSQGFDVMGGTRLDFHTFMTAEIEKWRKVVISSGAKVN